MNKLWLAALALGATAAAGSKSQGHNLMKLPSFRGIVEVRASLPGRMRLYVPSIAEAPERAAEAKRKLESTGAVRLVELTPRTGSVRIEYDEAQVQAAVVEGAFIHLMDLDARINAPEASRVEENLRALGRALNHGVLEASHGWLDARMLAGSALTLAGVRGIVRDGASTPGGLTLLWWASALFGARHA